MNRFVNAALIKDSAESPVFQLEKILDYFLEKFNDIGNDTKSTRELIQSFSIVNAFCKFNELAPLDINNITLDTTASVFKSKVSARLSNLILNEQTSSYDSLFIVLEKSMNDDDYKHIQELINDLRVKVKSATSFDKDLQRRVLDKLNKLQAELDKDINKLDLAKGRVLAIADMIGYANNKALAPIMNKTIELVNAIRGVEAKSDGIEFNNILTYEEQITDVDIIDNNVLEN
ncbi:MAG: hypothetical protein ACI8WT_003126 [Clostridium sp.]|jgi:hypothetical protein